MAKSQRVHTPEFRRQMVELHRTGRSFDEMVKEFGCTSWSIRQWVKQADRGVGRGDGGSKLSRLEYDCGPDIVHATVATGEKMLEHIRYFESLPLSPCPEATFSTIDEARQWIVNNPRPAWRMALATAAAVRMPRVD